MALMLEIFLRQLKLHQWAVSVCMHVKLRHPYCCHKRSFVASIDVEHFAAKVQSSLHITPELWEWVLSFVAFLTTPSRDRFGLVACVGAKDQIYKIRVKSCCLSYHILRHKRKLYSDFVSRSRRIISMKDHYSSEVLISCWLRTTDHMQRLISGNRALLGVSMLCLLLIKDNYGLRCCFVPEQTWDFSMLPEHLGSSLPLVEMLTSTCLLLRFVDCWDHSWRILVHSSNAKTRDLQRKSRVPISWSNTCLIEVRQTGGQVCLEAWFPDDVEPVIALIAVWRGSCRACEVEHEGSRG